MTRDQQLKTLNSPRASKEQLREALAASLGVDYERLSKEKVITIFTQCRDTFLEAYKKHTGFDYSFGARDGVALSNIIKKIEALTKADTLVTFQAFIWNLPIWYKENAFSLTRINGNFNEIVASIKQNGGKQQVTSDFKDRVAERIRARQSKQ